MLCNGLRLQRSYSLVIHFSSENRNPIQHEILSSFLLFSICSGVVFCRSCPYPGRAQCNAHVRVGILCRPARLYSVGAVGMAEGGTYVLGRSRIDIDAGRVSKSVAGTTCK